MPCSNNILKASILALETVAFFHRWPHFVSKSALEFGVYCSCCKGNDLDLTNSTKKLHIQVCFSVHDCSGTWSRISQGLPAAFLSIVRRHYITFCVFISRQAKPLFLTFGAFIFTSSTLTINLITERKPLLTFFSGVFFLGFFFPPCLAAVFIPVLLCQGQLLNS